MRKPAERIHASCARNTERLRARTRHGVGASSLNAFEPNPPRRRTASASSSQLAARPLRQDARRQLPLHAPCRSLGGRIVAAAYNPCRSGEYGYRYNEEAEVRQETRCCFEIGSDNVA